MGTASLGKWGEWVACGYLVGKGYRVVARSWRCGRVGEIDLIVRRGRVLVFVEVKTRRSGRFGRPEEAVDGRKQRRLLLLAETFVRSLPAGSPLRGYQCRLDVIAIHRPRGVGWRIRHLPGAFEGGR
jgi:putative endonuclease